MSRLIATATSLYILTLSMALPSAQPQPDGESIFRFDTLGSEQLWTDVLRMQHVIEDDVSPAAALSVGLKVDVDALPPALIAALQAGQVNLDDPAVTVQLLKLNAVVGVIGKVAGANNNLATVGITCALCHSTVDNSFAPGIGKRLDGWANTTLNAGAIIALSPFIEDKDPYLSWGPGKYDPRFRIFDGSSVIGFNRPTLPVVIPPIYSLAGVGFETFNADGPISYWNNYVGVTQMGGQGSFSDPRIGVTVTQTPDLVTPKLPKLFEYQLSLQKPPPPNGSFNRAAARRGADLFAGTAGCARCHQGPTFTDVLTGPIQEADGNGGRGVPGLRARLHGAEDQGERAVALLLQSDAHARVHAPQAGVRGQDGSWSLSGRDGRARWLRWPAPQETRRPGRGRQHGRRLHHGQRRRGMHLAGRRRDAVPRREGHQLGRRLACPLRDALAQCHQARRGHQRDRVAYRFPADVAAAAGEPDIVAKLKKGHKLGDSTFKVHVDGFNLMPFLSGKEKCPREGFIYWSDDGDLMALRFQQYKLVFAEQNARGPRGLACAADADAHPQAL